MLRLFWHWITLVLGLYLISLIHPLGISYDRRADLLWAALVLIIANTIIKPLLILFTLPLVLLTLGLFMLVINGLLLYWLPDFVHGFHVPSFTSAFFGALILSFITGIFTGWEKKRQRRVVRTGPAAKSGGVIDI
jgi:putative membrane protein